MTLMTMIQKMSEGLGHTLSIFFLTLLFSLPLGMLIALMRMSKIRPLRGTASVFISILRGTPLMLQLLAVTYGPYYLSVGISKMAEGMIARSGPNFFLNALAGLELSVARNKLIPVVIAYSINYAAYFAEIYRAGIESMPLGQYEAAAVLGYSRVQTFFHIILPQVIKRVVPPVTNEVITLVKDTSIAFAVAYQEMFTIGKQIANSQSSFTPFLIAGVFYFVFNALVAWVMARIEKKLDYYR